jgi:signal transduction histidine kinase
MTNKSEFPISVLFLMGAGAVALLIIVGTSIWLSTNTARLGIQVMEARKTRTVASEVLETLLNAETSQRGYLLTDKARYLDPYVAAGSTLKNDLAALDALERNNSTIKPLLVRLKLASADKMAELGDTVALAQSGHRDEALAIVNTDRGINEMDDARRILDRVVDNAEMIVAGDIDQLNSNARFLQWITTIGGALVVAFGIGAMWLIFRAIRQAVGARREVEYLNVSLEDRVIRRTAALTRANEEIQRFAYIVSHDLRAPLVNIMGFTSELEVNTKSLQDYFTAGSEDVRAIARAAALEAVPEAVKFIRSSTGKMDRLINAILKLSREGRRELMAEEVDLKKVFEGITASLQHQIDETKTTIDLSPRLPMLHGDRLALEQVFTNLFDNALKYLQPGRPGEIVVGSENASDSVVITVRDNGRGIAANDQERVFELFRRAGRQDQAGEGIGLAHVRALVRRLGGDISVTSELGVGSEFRVLLPRFLPSDTGNAS